MTRLFADLYLDEDVHVLVADLLRAKDFQVVTAREAGRLGQADSEQLHYAASQRLAILTHNRVDFEALHRHYVDTSQVHSGIIIARQHRPYELAHRL